MTFVPVSDDEIKWAIEGSSAYDTARERMALEVQASRKKLAAIRWMIEHWSDYTDDAGAFAAQVLTVLDVTP
jgi:cupin superfamily acireductone dioxygenase involved in methionine salvage